MPKFSSIGRESCVIGGMFFAFCAAAGAYVWVEWPSASNLTAAVAESPVEVVHAAADGFLDAAMIAEDTQKAVDEAINAISVAKDQHKARQDMEAWWRYHQIEIWWKLRHQQTVQHRPERRRIVSNQVISDAALGEQSWGSPLDNLHQTVYDPPRYLTDTSRWPLHGPVK